MDAHRPLQLDAVIVDEALRLEPSIVPARHCELHAPTRHLEQPLIAGADLCGAMFSGERNQPPLAEAVGAELTANVAQHQFRRAGVGGDDALQIAVRNVAALIAHRRKLETFVEDFARLAGTASWHRPANVAL